MNTIIRQATADEDGSSISLGVIKSKAQPVVKGNKDYPTESEKEKRMSEVEDETLASRIIKPLQGNNEEAEMERPPPLEERLRELKRRQITAIREIEKYNQQRLMIQGLENSVRVLEEHAKLTRQTALPIHIQGDEEIELIERGNRAIAMSAKLRGESVQLARTVNVVDPLS